MSVAPDVPLAQDVPVAPAAFAPADPGFIADPYPVFARMRDAGRVLHYPPRDLFLLTRFADVHAALRHRGLGRVYAHRYTDARFGRRPPGAGSPRWQASERYSLLNLEPPDHTRIRRLVTKVFTARAVAAMRPRIQQICAETLDRALGGRRFDLIADFAQPYSVRVICALLGVPQQDGPRLLGWSHAIVKMYEFSTSPGQRRAAENAADEFIGYVVALVADRRARPREDLITELAQVADEGERLTDEEIISTVIVLLNAGHEATVNTLGNGMRALLSNPEQWDRIISGEVNPADAVEEMVRWDGPLQLFERWVLEDGVELGGRPFAVGERIGLLFGSADRDPGHFPDPDRFDIGRADASHIGFGGGIHFCIGAPLARLEIELSLAGLAGGAPALRMLEAPEYQPFFVIRGLRGLQVQT